MGDITLFQVIVVGLLLFIAWWTTKCLAAIEGLTGGFQNFGNAVVNNVGIKTNEALADLYKEIEEIRQMLYTIEEKVEHAAIDIDMMDKVVDRIDDKVGDLHIDAKFRDSDLGLDVEKAGPTK